MGPDVAINQQEIEDIIGKPVNAWQPAHTDCSFPSFIATTEDQTYFIKWSDAPTVVFQQEASGLKQLTQLYPSIPQVHSFSEQALVLDYVEAVEATNAHWQNLGSQLAQMHRTPQKHFGFFEYNSIGLSSQRNPVTLPSPGSWADFFWNHRIEFKLEQIKSRYQESFKPSLLDSLHSAVDKTLKLHQPTPSLVHGDLWSGNILCSREQEVFLIDPAASFSDREVDIAMTECFGGFPDAFYQSYNKAWPLDSGYEQRKHIYNLYHMLNHHLIFGDNYKMSCLKIMEIIIG